jgi:hypothetical protein
MMRFVLNIEPYSASSKFQPSCGPAETTAVELYTQRLAHPDPHRLNWKFSLSTFLPVLGLVLHGLHVLLRSVGKRVLR